MRWLGLLKVGVIAAVILASGSAGGQSLPSPPPSILDEVTASDPGHGDTRLVLKFSPAAPKPTIINDGTDSPSVAFPLSTRGTTARALGVGQGLLRAIDFEQSDTVLILHLRTSQKVQIAPLVVDDRTLALQLAPMRGAQVATVPPAGLPKSVQLGPGEDGFEVVFLKYADVSEVVGLLTDGLTIKSNDSFVPQEPNFGSAGMTGSASFTPPQNPVGQTNSDPLAQSVDDAIAVDRRLNAIILKGSPERIAALKAKIAKIDVAVTSVLLETVFVELDQSGARNVGLDFNNSSGQLAVATYQRGSFVPIGQSSSGLTSVALQAAIYAQVNAGHGRIVSKPRIAAQSGSTAKIVTGDALPILTSIALSGVNAVSQQVQYVNVGVTLQIAPRVSNDGYVTSHVFCVVSSVTGASQGYPTISQREAETSATVRDGDTFVIGGLTEESTLKSKAMVPILGQAPGIGALFHLNTSSSSKTELYIVVTPHVLTNGEATRLLQEIQPR